MGAVQTDPLPEIRAVGQPRHHALIAGWHARLTGASSRTRQTLRETITTPVVVDAAGHFEVEFRLGSFAGEIGVPTFVVRPAGLEPATPGLEGRCSIH
jgi:hypothetical protein